MFVVFYDAFVHYNQHFFGSTSLFLVSANFRLVKYLLFGIMNHTLLIRHLRHYRCLLLWWIQLGHRNIWITTFQLLYLAQVFVSRFRSYIFHTHVVSLFWFLFKFRVLLKLCHIFSSFINFYVIFRWFRMNKFGLDYSSVGLPNVPRVIFLLISKSLVDFILARVIVFLRISSLTQSTIMYINALIHN